MNWVSITVFIVGAVLYGIYGLEDLWRTFAIRRLTKRLGFTYLRQRLPEALSLYGTLVAHRRFTWNVIDGERSQMRVIVFDCQVGEGQGSWRRTVIATKGGSNAISAANFKSGMKVDSSGGWEIRYYPQEVKRGLMPISELKTILNSI